MTKTFNITEKERLRFALLCSLLIHLIIVGAMVFTIFQRQELRFKKGTGEIPNKIKISGFIPQQLPPQPKPSPRSQPQTNSSQSQSRDSKQSQANIAKRDSDTSQSRLKAQDSHNPTQNSQATQENTKQNNTTQKTKNDIDLRSLTLNSNPYPSPQTPDSRQSKAEQSPSLAAIFAQYPRIDSITKRDVSDLYGEEFGDYGLVEQDFIINNLRDIGRITGRYLKYPPDAIRLGQQGVNIVQFYLHPNGDISDLRLIKPSGYVILDRNSERTIEIAYKDYPHPVSKVLIRIRVSMELYYY